jgi:nitrogenase molybdenum-iron protein beta chain
VSQNADKTIDHFGLFHEPEYADMLKAKRRDFENAPADAEITRVAEWTKTPEYQEKNFAREALTINPAKACQPLGAVFAAVGFEKTLPFVHGSQGCVAYYRSHFSRHFKEPTSCVSSSMTEDAAVFGGLNNMIDGLANAYSMYKPKMIAVSTTCMAEVIGDDLNAFIKTAKEKGSVPAEFDVPFAHTPAFVGSHITGYDNVMKGIVDHFWNGKAGTEPKAERQENGKINFIGGFDGYTIGNLREIKRIFGLMGVDYTILGDNSDVWDTPTDGEFRMYDGGTTLEAAAQAVHAKATISMQQFCTEKTLDYIKDWGQETVAFNHPVGVAGTDRFLMEVARLSGRVIPEELERERGRLVDAIADSNAHIHGKKFAIYGDPDLCLGLAAFLLELGAEPTHILSTNGNKVWAEQVRQLLASSPFGVNCHVYAGKDLWHMRSLLFTSPVDFLIGSTYGKYLERDTGTPLIRIGFPIFDRHHHHRYPVWGYQGGMNVLVKILDKIFDEMDRTTNIAGKTDLSFDIIR